jgi:hypothetical protein
LHKFYIKTQNSSNYLSDIKWMPNNRQFSLNELVYVSNDADGGAICIGRAYHKGDLMPGKVRVKIDRCHVSYGGKEHSIKDFEYLMNSPRFSWVPSSNGEVPPNAVVGGRTSSNEVLYVGRAHHGEFIVPGKVHKSHRCLYFAYGDKEHSKNSYEVLVMQPESQIYSSNMMGGLQSHPVHAQPQAPLFNSNIMVQGGLQQSQPQTPLFNSNIIVHGGLQQSQPARVQHGWTFDTRLYQPVGPPALPGANQVAFGGSNQAFASPGFSAFNGGNQATAPPPPFNAASFSENGSNTASAPGSNQNQALPPFPPSLN